MNGVHVAQTGNDMMAKVLHVFSATGSRIEAEAVAVKVERAREGFFTATEPTDDTVGRQHEFSNAMPSRKTLNVSFRLHLQHHQVVIAQGI